MAATAPRLPASTLALLELEARECEERDVVLKTGRPPGTKEVSAIYVAGDAFLCKALEAVQRNLGLPGLRIRYFTEPAHLRGFYNAVLDPTSIWVRADRPLWEQLKTIGHECWHAAEDMRDEPADEVRARAYGLKLRRSDPGDWPLHVRAPWYDEHGARL